MTQHAKLAPFEALRAVKKNTQRRGFFEVLPRRLRRVRRLGHFFETQTLGNCLRKIRMDVEQLRHHTLADGELFDLAQLKDKGVDDMILSVSVWLI